MLTTEQKLKAAGLSAADLVALLEQEAGVSVADLKAAVKTSGLKELLPS